MRSIVDWKKADEAVTSRGEIKNADICTIFGVSKGTATTIGRKSEELRRERGLDQLSRNGYDPICVFESQGWTKTDVQNTYNAMLRRGHIA